MDISQLCMETAIHNTNDIPILAAQKQQKQRLIGILHNKHQQQMIKMHQMITSQFLPHVELTKS